MKPKPNQPKRIITWDEYWKGIQNLKQQLDTVDWIKEDTLFFGIPRGGTILSVLLTYCLGKGMCFDWNTICELYRQEEYLGIPLALIDDIMDTGCTMGNRIDRLYENMFHGRCLQIKTVAMFKRHDCPIQPDIFYRTIEDDDYLVFPYEEK